MPVDAASLRIVNRYRSQTLALRTRLLRFVELSWLGLNDYRTPDIEQFTADVIPVVSGAQRQMASMTDAYLAALATLETGERVLPVGLDVDELSTTAIRGVDVAEVYMRPGVSVWTALSEGSTLPAAVAKGLQRALDLAGTDIQLTKTHASRKVMEAQGVGGYRRVLEGSKSCGLCIVASTQRYHVGDLMPIHGGCDCGVLPIYGDDPGRVIDFDTLDGVHDAIAERFGGWDASARGGILRDGRRIPNYREVIVERRHGELGPVLTVRGQSFTGPSDLSRPDTGRVPPTRHGRTSA